MTRFGSWGLALVGILILGASAGADPARDSRLLFDPGALDRGSAADRDPAEAPRTGATQGRIWIPAPPELPNVEDTTLGSGRGLSTGLPGVKPQRSNASTDFEPRLNLGTLSIGVETETTIKQRSLAGDGDKDPARDAILDDPRKQRGFLPFIGLSAKSKLP